MDLSFAETLRRLRTEKGLSQQQLADRLFVDRSSVAHWEIGRRVPSAALITRLAEILDTDVASLLGAMEGENPAPTVILVDDERIILTGGMPILRQVMPGASVTGFLRPSEALAFARRTPVELAFLDIEMGKTSGLTLCRELLAVNPRTNVVFLTAYPEYSLDAWKTEARGFMLKPMTSESVKEQLKKLRIPFSAGGVEA